MNSCASKKVEISFENICRICLCELSRAIRINIFSSKPFYLNLTALEILKEISSIEFDEEKGYPKALCFKCAEQIKTFYLFRRKIENSDKEIRRKLKDNVSKNVCEGAIVGDNDVIKKVTPPNTELNHLNISNSKSCNGVDVRCSSDKRDKDVTNNILSSNLSQEETPETDELHCVWIENSAEIIVSDDDSTRNDNVTSITESALIKFLNGHSNNVFNNNTSQKKPLLDSVDPTHSSDKENTEHNLVKNRTSPSDQNNDRNVIKELLTCSISDSIIVTNNCNNNSFRRGHLNKASVPEQKLSCTKCPKMFTSYEFLERHLLYHELDLVDMNQPQSISTTNSNSQPQCNNNLPKLQSLTNNVPSCSSTNLEIPSKLQTALISPQKENVTRTSAPIGMEYCKHCGRIFPTAQLAWHIYLKHKNETKTPTQCLEKCKFCGMQLFDWELKQHIRKEHLVEHKQDVLERQLQMNVCNQCDKRCRTKKLLQKHIKSNHVSKFFCSICNEGFLKKKVRDLHLKDVHNIVQKSLCYMCGKMVTTTGLNEHYENHGKTPRKCPIENCTAILKNRILLKQHVVHVHKKCEASVVCEICGKVFLQQEHLRSHQRIHLHPSKLNHACLYCDRRFYSGSNLAKHVKRHLRKNEAYNCPGCEKPFAYEKYLNRHLESCLAYIVTSTVNIV